MANNGSDFTDSGRSFWGGMWWALVGADVAMMVIGFLTYGV